MASKGVKTIKCVVRCTIEAGKASPSPPVGPRLGQMGVNIMAFCKEFNELTEKYIKGVPITTVITAYDDRTADMKLLSPPTTYFIKRVLNIEKGAAKPGKEVVGELSLKHVYEIAKLKKQDQAMQRLSLQAICRCIMGSCKSMGVKVVP